mmetsp:Transcript_110098/g.316834  ORF Transcript_110098/g.316834 Transcript_110098/m.316834 type:complete len:476 (+) Transcript_110098:62-1489(+)
MLRASVILAACHVVRAGDHPWVWGGICELSAGEKYTWSAARGPEGFYAGSEMKLMSVYVGEQTEISAGKEPAMANWNSSVWADLSSGESVSLASDATSSITTVALHFDTSSWLSLFHLEPTASGHWTFFTSQLAHDLENGFHYLKDEHGHDIECVVHHHDHGTEEEAAGADHTEGGQGLGVALGATTLTILPALLTLPFVGPAVARIGTWAFPVMNSFASGAIAATSAFILLPETTHLIGEGMSESGSHAVWGSSMMFGWLIGVLIHHLTDIIMQGKGDVQTSAMEEAARGGGPEDADKRQPVDVSVAAAVVCGDACHNLVCGMVTGFAARSCSASVMWAVTAGGIAHELPQEIADYIVLITKANVAWPKAMVLNVLSALPALVGAAIAYEVDVSDNFQGVFLTIGAGVYLFVALTELAPSILEIRSPYLQSSALRFVAFFIGATALGLVLLGHDHCYVAVPNEDGLIEHNGHYH